MIYNSAERFEIWLGRSFRDEKIFRYDLLHSCYHHDNLIKAVERIEALSRIEHFIYSQNSSSGSEKDSFLDEINNIREIIKKQSESGDIVLKYERFDEFLKRAEQHGLSFDEYNAFEKMTEELSTIDLSYSVQARRLLLRLEQHQNNADES